jgi:HEAT repeat protein
MKCRGNLLSLCACISLCALQWISGAAFGSTATQADIEKAVAAIRTYDYGGSRKALIAVEQLINETYGNPALRAAIEKELVKVLESDAALSCKQFVCQKLSVIGSDASLPALATMLADSDSHLVEAACYAILPNPSPAAGGTLRAALGKARGDGLVAVINVLGERRDAEAAEAIAGLAADENAAVAGSAIAALGKIANGKASEVLIKLLQSEDDSRCIAADHAYLQCAQELERRGSLAEAKAAYARLGASGKLERIRKIADLALARIEAQPASSEPSVDFDRIKARSLFDGKTFEGWEGNLDVFRIEDGAIVGGTMKQRIPRNEFLCTTKEFGDFELRLKFRLLGPKDGANAGVQIRSRRIPNHNEMIGYQADMGQNYWGNLYDESRRRKVLTTVDQEKLAAVLKLGEWNEYVIRCVGKRVQLWINGHNTVDYTEPDDSIEQTGFIGVQIHAGPPSEAWYKDITIKVLR